MRRKKSKKNALQKALDYIFRRDHSRYELENKLSRKGYERHEIDDALEYLVSRGYVDDFEFASGFVRHCQRIRKLGTRRIAAELRSRGVDRHVIDRAFNEEYDHDLEDENMDYLIKKQLKSGRGRDKISRYLYRKGYPTEKVRRLTEKLQP